MKAYELYTIGAESVASEVLDREISDLFAGLRAELGSDDGESPWDDMVERFQQPGMGGHVPPCDIDRAWGY